MIEYHFINLPAPPVKPVIYQPPPPPDPTAWVPVCSICGAVVLMQYQQTHADWHDTLTGSF